MSDQHEYTTPSPEALEEILGIHQSAFRQLMDFSLTSREEFQVHRPLCLQIGNFMHGMEGGTHQEVGNIWGPPTSHGESWGSSAAPTNELTLLPRPNNPPQETIQCNHNHIKHTNDCINEAAKWITNVHVSLHNLQTSVEDASRRGIAISKQEWEALGAFKTQLMGLRSRLDDQIGALESMDTKVRVSSWEPQRQAGWVSVTGGREPPGLSTGRSRASTVSTAAANKFLGELPPGLGGGRVQRADYELTRQREAGHNIWESQSRRADQVPRRARQS